MRARGSSRSPSCPAMGLRKSSCVEPPLVYFAQPMLRPPPPSPLYGKLGLFDACRLTPRPEPPPTYAMSAPSLVAPYPRPPPLGPFGRRLATPAAGGGNRIGRNLACQSVGPRGSRGVELRSDPAIVRGAPVLCVWRRIRRRSNCACLGRCLAQAFTWPVQKGRVPRRPLVCGGISTDFGRRATTRRSPSGSVISSSGSSPTGAPSCAASVGTSAITSAPRSSVSLGVGGF